MVWIMVLASWFLDLLAVFWLFWVCMIVIVCELLVCIDVVGVV